MSFRIKYSDLFTLFFPLYFSYGPISQRPSYWPWEIITCGFFPVCCNEESRPEYLTLTLNLIQTLSLVSTLQNPNISQLQHPKNTTSTLRSNTNSTTAIHPTLSTTPTVHKTNFNLNPKNFGTKMTTSNTNLHNPNSSLHQLLTPTLPIPHSSPNLNSPRLQPPPKFPQLQFQPYLCCLHH